MLADVVGKGRYRGIQEAEAAKSERAGSHPCSSAHTVMFLMCRVDNPGKSSQTHEFHIGQQTFGWKKKASLAQVELWISRSIPK